MLAPLSIAVLTACSIHGKRGNYYVKSRWSQDGKPVGPLTQRSFKALNATRCHGDRNRYQAPWVVVNGHPLAARDLHARGSGSLEVPEEQEYIYMLWQVENRSHGNVSIVQYQASLRPVSYHNELRAQLRDYLSQELSMEGLLVSDEDFLSKLYFDCPWRLDHTEWQVFLHLRIADAQSGQKFRDVLLPFLKQCGPRRMHSWLHDVWGTADDFGHLGGFLPLVAVGFSLLLASLPGGPARLDSCRHGPCSGWLARLALPVGLGREGKGCMEIAVLLVGGIVGAIGHGFTVMKGNRTAHELYHVMAHSFMVMMGLLGLATHSVLALTRATLAVFALAPVSLAFIFLLHDQHSQHSVDMHRVYDGVLALFGLCRLGALYDPQLVLPAGFLGLWAASLFMFSAQHATTAQRELGLDVAGAALLAGLLSAGVASCVVLLGGALLRRGGVAYDELDSEHGIDDVKVVRASVEATKFGKEASNGSLCSA